MQCQSDKPFLRSKKALVFLIMVGLFVFVLGLSFVAPVPEQVLHTLVTGVATAGVAVPAAQGIQDAMRERRG